MSRIPEQDAALKQLSEALTRSYEKHDETMAELAQAKRNNRALKEEVRYLRQRCKRLGSTLQELRDDYRREQEQQMQEETPAV